MTKTMTKDKALNIVLASNLSIDNKVLCMEIVNGVSVATFNPNATRLHIADSLEMIEKEISTLCGRYIMLILLARNLYDAELSKALDAIKRIASIRYGWIARGL